MEFSNYIGRIEDNELTELLNMSDYELASYIKQSITDEIQKRSKSKNEKLKYDNKHFVIYFGDLKNFTGVNFSLKRCYYDKYLDEYVINIIDISWQSETYNYCKSDKTWSFELLNNHLSHDFITFEEIDPDTFDKLWEKFANIDVPISVIKNRIINEIKMYEEH